MQSLCFGLMTVLFAGGPDGRLSLGVPGGDVVLASARGAAAPSGDRPSRERMDSSPDVDLQGDLNDIGGDALGSIAIPSDGSDGPFVFVPDSPPSGNTMTIDLGLAPTAAWDTPGGDVNGDGRGDGVYDSQKWAVVFKYTEVTIPSGKTVKFANHPTRAPVVWLVQGNVTVNGTINLDGLSPDGTSVFAEPGPGGFRGGRGFLNGEPGSGGFGPGGAGYVVSPGAYGDGGSYGTRGAGSLAGPTYGAFRIVPLIGGSGGSGRNNSTGDGGAGGGAILIAAGQSVSVPTGGSIRALGNDGDNTGGGGSGGAIRIIADAITVGGTLYAYGGNNGYGEPGGHGRIRLEANPPIDFTGSSSPSYTSSDVDDPPVIWPEDAPDPAPTVRAAKIITDAGEFLIPDDPASSFNQADLSIDTLNPVVIEIEAHNVPTGTGPEPQWNMVARVVPLYGATQNVTATYMSSDGASSVWRTVEFTLPRGDGPTAFSAIQVRASRPVSR